MFDTVRLRELVGAMLRGLEDGGADKRLMPSAAAAEIGNFAANRARLRGIVAGETY
jgi:hypothetical protein